MNEALYEKIELGLLLSKADLLMSKAEATESCKIYFKIISSKSMNNLLILELQSKSGNSEKTKKTLLKTWLDRLALTKEAYLIIGSTEETNKEKGQPKIEMTPFFFKNSPLLKELTNENQNPSFKISIRNISISEGKEKEEKNGREKKRKTPLSIETFAKNLAEYGFHKTDIHTPNLEFTILNGRKTILGIKLWTNTDPFEKRKAHFRPLLHPTAINPKLARAMINLAGAEKEILDPFCGMGGTLLEASLIGLNAKGIDISPEMIKRAKLNLQNEESKKHITLYEMDALNWKKRTECVVTDLPYGKSSKLDRPISELLAKFLIQYGNLTEKMVLCFPEGTEYKLPKNWEKIYDFKIYIHKSLTRNIIVLQKIEEN